MAGSGDKNIALTVIFALAELGRIRRWSETTIALHWSCLSERNDRLVLPVLKKVIKIELL